MALSAEEKIAFKFFLLLLEELLRQSYWCTNEVFKPDPDELVGYKGVMHQYLIDGIIASYRLPLRINDNGASSPKDLIDGIVASFRLCLLHSSFGDEAPSSLMWRRELENPYTEVKQFLSSDSIYYIDSILFKCRFFFVTRKSITFARHL